MKIPDHPLHFQNKNEWRSWLEENHATMKDAWLAISKNRVTHSGVHYEEAVEEALCFGWIDGAMKSATVDFFFLRFSPRTKNSVWSMSCQSFGFGYRNEQEYHPGFSQGSRLL